MIQLNICSELWLNMNDSLQERVMRIILSFLLVLFSTYSWAQNSSTIAKALESEIKKSKISNKNLGLSVLDDHGQEVFSVNKSKLMVPASLTKLFTAAVALRVFTPGHKFETHLMSDATVKNNILEGNLYFKGGGDPAFISEKMWYLVNEFTRNNIHEISGSIVVDDTLFDAERFDPGRDPNRVNRAYDAPIGAASFNWNSVNIFIRPGGTIGDLAQVIADPISPYIKLENKIKTVKSGSPQITIDRVDGVQGDTVKISGVVPINQKEIVKYVSVSKPDYWTGYHLIEFLKQRGIIVKGSVTLGKTPANAISLAKSEGQPLYETLADMLKFSNNYIAEMLTKQFAVKNNGNAQGTMAAGLAAMTSHLSKLGLSSGDYTLTSPSGLSQKNQIRPAKLAEVLMRVRKDLRSFPELAAGLPLAGVDGTLKSRMKGTPAEEKVRGKTGLLNGAVGLAGYAGRADGTTLTYVFIYNGEDNYLPVWSLFDSMASRLVE